MKIRGGRGLSFSPVEDSVENYNFSHQAACQESFMQRSELVCASVFRTLLEPGKTIVLWQNFNRSVSPNGKPLAGHAGLPCLTVPVSTQEDGLTDILQYPSRGRCGNWQA